MIRLEEIQGKIEISGVANPVSFIFISNFNKYFTEEFLFDQERNLIAIFFSIEKKRKKKNKKYFDPKLNEFHKSFESVVI